MLIYKRVERLSDSGDMILDIGAKGGSNVTGTEATVAGIDLELSRSTSNSDAESLYVDGREHPFDDNVFDYVVLNQVFQHVDGRPLLFREVWRVLIYGGVALFSFPNRLIFDKPHGLPRFASFFPKPVGLYVSRLFLDDSQYEYYKNGLFPLSPIGAQFALRQHFDSIRYVTIDESAQNKEIYGEQFAPQLFVTCLPIIDLTTKINLLQWLFELVWGHVSYKYRI